MAIVWPLTRSEAPGEIAALPALISTGKRDRPSSTDRTSRSDAAVIRPVIFWPVRSRAVKAKSGMAGRLLLLHQEGVVGLGGADHFFHARRAFEDFSPAILPEGQHPLFHRTLHQLPT